MRKEGRRESGSGVRTEDDEEGQIMASVEVWER